MVSSPVRCSVVIATLDRADSLRLVLDCLGRQTRPPFEIIVVVAGDAAALAARLPGYPVRWLSSSVKSAAAQRNQGADAASGEILAFLDDDIEFAPDLFARLLAPFDFTSDLGGLHPRIQNMDRPPPGRLFRAYCQLQAGYAHADYGGRLFGPAINCLPLFSDGGPSRVRADWLPSTCLFLRAPLFQRHRFPAFTGYSFAEDVHLTARLAREAPLYFLREPAILHHSLPSEFKANRAALIAGKLHNMAVVAREAMGVPPASLWWRWQLHRLFLAAILLLRRPPHWRTELHGLAQARL